MAHFISNAALTMLSATSLFSSSMVLAQGNFTSATVDDEVQIGYGVDIGDVDGDGMPDILLADKKLFVWYRNPDWKKHILASDLTKQDNVCIAARDIDGDGKVEIAVGAEWNPGDTVGSGAVFYLQAGEDRTQPWTPIKLPCEPVTHRMRWVRYDDARYALLVSPLHGRGNRAGEGAGVKLMAYHKPDDPYGEWRTEVLEDTMHVTHNLDVGQWIDFTPGEEILYLGREGAMLLAWNAHGWSKSKLPNVDGGGEIRMSRASFQQPFLAVIEPFHGDKLVVYRRGEGDEMLGDKRILDGAYNQGHAVAVADLFDAPGDEIVAGWRSRNSDGEVGLKLYYESEAPGGESEWRSAWIDRNGMAAEDVRIADLNGDGKLDIVASGRDTHNLKIYWNETPDKTNRKGGKNHDD